MPTYEYECPVHGAFDEIRRIAERNEPTACPECAILCERNVIIAPPATTIMTDELRDLYGDVIDAVTLPWDRAPDMNSVGDVNQYLRSKGISPDAIVPRKEWDKKTGRPSFKERNGFELDRRPVLGRR